MEHKAILGIDVSQATLDVALLHDQRQRQASFPNSTQGFTKLAHWLTTHAPGKVHACLEATGRYGDAVALFLYEAGHTVSVVNPARIQAFARATMSRNKTDSGDARLIAHFCELHQPASWTPPPPEVRTLQELVRRLATLEQMHHQESNRLKAGLAAEAVQTLIEDHLRYLEAQIELVQQAIRDHIDQFPDLRRQRDLLTTIPGIGEKTATILLGEIGDLSQFKRAPQLAAYAGLTPRKHLSGTSVHRPARLCKTGNAALRKALYFPALSALRYNPLIMQLRTRLRAAGKRPMQIVGAAMRKLLHLVFGVLKSGLPFDPNYSKAAFAS
jgi:transposase